MPKSADSLKSSMAKSASAGSSRTQGSRVGPSQPSIIRQDVLTFADAAEFRAHSILADGTIFAIKDDGTWMYRGDRGANVADDGTSVLKPDDVDVTENGRAYPHGTISVTLPDGMVEQHSTVGGSSLLTTPIEAGTGTLSIPTTVGASNALPCAVPVSTLVQIEIDAAFSAAGSKIFSGTLIGSAKRIGSGALSIDAQALAAGTVLSDSLWNPQLIANGNSLEFHITADSLYEINPRGAVRITATDMSGDASVSALALARAVVLADAPTILLYSDVGTTPSTPSDGTLITGWADQSGNGHDYVAASGNEATYRVPSRLEMLLATGVSYTCTDAMSSGSVTYRWRMKPAVPATHGILFQRHDAPHQVIVSSGATWNSDGSNIFIIVDGTSRLLGTQLAGMHDYEIRLDDSTHTAQLFVDGIGQDTISISTMSINAYTPFVGYNNTSYGPAADFYGVSISVGVGTNDEMNHWIAMATLAWGAHD